jgi:iron complex outermembrane receptor protein
MGKILSIVLFLVCTFVLCRGQLSGQVMIDSVIITQTKSQIFRHLTPDKIANDTLEGSSTDFLRHIVSGQVQQNTPGGLMTLLHRGMGNRHLPILWNGVNIQNVLNGSYDLNLIPTFLFDKLTFYTTGTPALSGNNSMAGALDISQRQSVATTTLMSSISSLQNFAVGAKTVISKNIVLIKAGAQWTYDRNIFLYQYVNSKYLRQPTNFNVANITGECQVLLSHSSYLTSEIWWQYAGRDILVSTTSAPSAQHQTDNNLRVNLTHHMQTKHHLLKTSLNYMKEYLNFKTPAIDSRASTDIIAIRSEWSENKKNDYLFALGYRKDIASPNFYQQTYIRQTLQITGNKKLNWHDCIISDFAMRQDIVDSKLMPTAINVHVSYRFLSLNLARNYTLPGFNDLYWPTGGNSALKTEKSLQGELKSIMRISNCKIKISAYGNLVDNWIQWVPQKNGIWTAVNQKKVLSSGFECFAESTYYYKKIRFSPELEYAFNSTTAISHDFDPSLIGKQLIYVPRHKAILTLKFRYGNHHMIGSYSYTGIRYETPDNAVYLEPIQLTNITYMLYSNNWNWKINANNVFNRHYNYVRYYPMPGLNIGITITYKINK